MKNILPAAMFSLFSLSLPAAIFEVGPTKTYVSPNALYLAGVVQNGDTITIDEAVYGGTDALVVWQADDLYITGVGGRPHLEANGEYIWGKGIWVIAGDNCTVENIEFSGASVPDQNGAGIRLDGTGLTVRHCYFHHNENGILTSNPYAGHILIEYSEFAHNGYGDGFSHNLYVGHVDQLTFRFNYSHHALTGHNLKSRADVNIITCNRIMDEATGNSSRLIDLSNGGFTILMGNLFMQGDNAPNNNMVGYGLEGLTNTENELYVINNTFVNKRQASCLFLDIKDGTTAANISNNIFTGTGNLINGPYTFMNSNIIDPDIGALLFAGEGNYDYRLEAGSPAIDAGSAITPVGNYSLTPEFSYLHPAQSEIRTISNNTIDAGAYEYVFPVSSLQPLQETIKLFPNPTSGIVHIENGGQDYKWTIYNSTGELLIKGNAGQAINLSGRPAGFYFVKIATPDGSTLMYKMLTKI